MDSGQTLPLPFIQRQATSRLGKIQCTGLRPRALWFQTASSHLWRSKCRQFHPLRLWPSSQPAVKHSTQKWWKELSRQSARGIRDLTIALTGRVTKMDWNKSKQATISHPLAPAQLCKRVGCISSRLSLWTGAASGESKWITAPIFRSCPPKKSQHFLIWWPVPFFSATSSFEKGRFSPQVRSPCDASSFSWAKRFPSKGKQKKDGFAS